MTHISNFKTRNFSKHCLNHFCKVLNLRMSLYRIDVGSSQTWIRKQNKKNTVGKFLDTQILDCETCYFLNFSVNFFDYLIQAQDSGMQHRIRQLT